MPPLTHPQSPSTRYPKNHPWRTPVVPGPSGPSPLPPSPFRRSPEPELPKDRPAIHPTRSY